MGKAFTQALLDRNAAKVYAGARDPGTVDVTDARVVRVRLDITNPGDVAAAARLHRRVAGDQQCRCDAPRWRPTTSAHWRWRGRSRRCWPRPLDAVEKGRPEVLTHDWTRHVKDSVATDQETLYPDIQRSWDAGESPWKG